jgi:hypothetical protein
MRRVELLCINSWQESWFSDTQEIAMTKRTFEKKTVVEKENEFFELQVCLRAHVGYAR